MPHLRGAQLHCHAGVVAARPHPVALERHRVLHQVLLGEHGPTPRPGDAPAGIGRGPAFGDQARGHEATRPPGTPSDAGAAAASASTLRRTPPAARRGLVGPRAPPCSARELARGRRRVDGQLHPRQRPPRAARGPCLLKLRRRSGGRARWCQRARVFAPSRASRWARAIRGERASAAPHARASPLLPREASVARGVRATTAAGERAPADGGGAVPAGARARTCGPPGGPPEAGVAGGGVRSGGSPRAR